MRIDDVIRVEDKVAVVVGEGMARTNMAEQVVQRIALADLQGIEPLIDRCACRSGGLAGSIRTVIRKNVEIDQLCGIILRLEAGNQFADYALLIARTN